VESFIEIVQLLGFTEIGWGRVFLQATVVTLSLSVSGFFLGTIIGLTLTVAHFLGGPILRIFARSYGVIFRGIPDLFIIHLFYFGSSIWITNMYHLVGGTGFVMVPSFVVGVLALGMISGAYQMEVYRGAYLSIHRGQIQAALAYGMERNLIFKRIILPQGWRHAFPALGNLWQLILKDSSLISIIGVVEVMRQAHIAAGSTHRSFLFYSTAAAIHLVLTLVSSHIFRRLKRLSSAHRLGQK